MVHKHSATNKKPWSKIEKCLRTFIMNMQKTAKVDETDSTVFFTFFMKQPRLKTDFLFVENISEV